MTDTPTPTLAASPDAKPTPPSKDTLAMAARLKQHWTGDPAALDAALKNAGAEFKPDTRTDAEQAFDAGFPAPESAENYKLNFTGRTVGDPAALGALNGKYQDMFAAMALPGIAAQGVLDTLLDSAGRFGKLTTDAQRKLYQQEQKVLTEKLGKDIGDLKTIVGFAAKALDRVADQAFIKQLTETGAFSAAGILHMARQGQRLVHREQLAAKRTA